jgi:hypothetical protein
MEVDVRTEVEIDRPRHEVASYASDPDNATTWYSNIVEVDWKTPPPLRVGTNLGFVARFLGRRLAYTYEIRELISDERLVMSTSDGPFAMETTYEWADTPTGGTKMSIRNRGTPSGFANIAAPMMTSAMRRASQKDLARIKQILESSSE